MPIKYVERLNSKGNPQATNQVAYVYKNYYGPESNFFETDQFTFNSTMDDLNKFLKYFKIDIDNVNWEIPEDERKYSFFTNVEKLDDGSFEVYVTKHNHQMFDERCFQEHFIQVINEVANSKEKSVC